jgi:prephenate dehydrogenase
VTSAGPFAAALIAGGHGAVGRLLAQTLTAAGTTSLTLVDLRAAPVQEAQSGSVLVDDVTRPGARLTAALAAADLVILATPEEVALAAAGPVLAAMKPGSLLVETLSVKSRFAAAVGARAAGAEILGINPMFAPSLGFAGRSVLAVPYAAGPLADAFLALLAGRGARVIRLGAEPHDRACAALQVATHAALLGFGMALRAAGYDLVSVEPLMPPPHRTLLALLARMLGADPEVIRDIQAANPYAGEMRAHLRAAHQDLEQIVARGDPAEFRRLAGELRGIFGGGSDYAELCARLFAIA